MARAGACDLVREWMTTALASASPGARLPPDHAIARAAGVSQRTVATVMRELARQGAITRVHGSGSFAPRTSHESPPATQSAAERLRTEIRTAMNRGALQASHPLPSAKYFVQRYRVSPRTVARALGILHAEGCIARVGRRSWVGAIERAGGLEGRAEVLVVARDRSERAGLFSRGAYAFAYRHAESIMSAAGLRVRAIAADELRSLSRGWGRGSGTPYGLVFARADDTVMRQARAALDRARIEGSPPRLVVDWDAPRSELVPRTAHLLTRANMSTTLARTLAQYAADRVRRYPELVVFLSGQDPHDDRNSCLWSAGTVLRMHAELMHAEPSTRFRAVFLGPLARRYEPSLESIVEPGIATRLLSKHVPTPVATVAPCISFHRHLERALEQTSRRGMWVFRDSAQALDALAWCERHRVKVPHDTGIVALDSDPRTYHVGISRCEPDWERVGFVIAHAIIGDITLERTSRGFLRQSARVVEKMTT